MKLSSLQKGLVGHWTMAQDSLKGSLLADKTPYENDGTIYGATFTTDRKGQPNKAMYFDGVDDYIDCENITNLTNTSFTISAWIKVNDLSKYGTIFSQGNNTSNSPIISISLKQTFFELVNRDDSEVGLVSTPSHSILNNEWAFIVWVCTKTNSKLYVNREKIGDVNFTENTGTFNTQTIGVRRRLASM